MLGDARSLGTPRPLAFALLLQLQMETASGLVLNPVALISQVNNIFMLCLIIAALVAAWFFRDRLLSLLTGDDRIHWDSDSCCCKRRYRGKNLVRLFGETVGLLPMQICVQNLVVGDLPNFWVRGRTYLQVEVGADPPMVTEVIEDANPKCLPFQAKFTLPIRRGVTAGKVRFVVRSLHILGHSDVCECLIEQGEIVKWAGAGWSGRPIGKLRFRMDPSHHSLQHGYNLPSWIWMEFTLPEAGAPEGRIFGAFAIETKEDNFHDAAQFKHYYPIHSGNGSRLPGVEPAEGAFSRLQTCIRYRRQFIHCTGCMVVALLAAIFSYWFYYGACRLEYRKIEVLRLHGVEFPPLAEDRDRVLKRCGLEEDTFFVVGRAVMKRSFFYSMNKINKAAHSLKSAAAPGRQLTSLPRLALHNITQAIELGYDGGDFPASNGKGTAASERAPQAPLANTSQVEHASQPGAADSVDVLNVNETSTADSLCRPGAKALLDSCKDLPKGAKAILPVPILSYIIPCNPKTCGKLREGGLEVTFQIALFAVLILVAANFVTGWWLAGWERQIFRVATPSRSWTPSDEEGDSHEGTAARFGHISQGSHGIFPATPRYETAAPHNKMRTSTAVTRAEAKAVRSLFRTF